LRRAGHHRPAVRRPVVVLRLRQPVHQEAAEVRAAAVLALAGVALALAGCDSDKPEPPKTSTGAAICATSAKPIAVPAEFPADFPLPRGSIPVNTSNSSGGIVLQAISPDGFRDVLKQLQDGLPKA